MGNDQESSPLYPAKSVCRAVNVSGVRIDEESGCRPYSFSGKRRVPRLSGKGGFLAPATWQIPKRMSLLTYLTRGREAQAASRNPASPSTAMRSML
jgi:hypothetical protein